METVCAYKKLQRETFDAFEVNFIFSETPVKIVVFVYKDSEGNFGYSYVIESEIDFDLYGSSRRFGHKNIEMAINEAQREIINSLPENMQDTMRAAIFG